MEKKTIESGSQKMDRQCYSCKNEIKQQNGISLCKCNIVYHDKCLLNEFFPSITNSQQIKCMRCKEEVVLKVWYRYSWQKFTPIDIIFLIIAIVSLIIILALTISNKLQSSYGWAIFSILWVTMLMFFIVARRKKYILFQTTNKYKIITNENLKMLKHQRKRDQPERL